jgi:hypothetical protein
MMRKKKDRAVLSFTFGTFLQSYEPISPVDRLHQHHRANAIEPTTQKLSDVAPSSPSRSQPRPFWNVSKVSDSPESFRVK